MYLLTSPPDLEMGPTGFDSREDESVSMPCVGKVAR